MVNRKQKASNLLNEEHVNTIQILQSEITNLSGKIQCAIIYLTIIEPILLYQYHCHEKIKNNCDFYYYSYELILRRES